MPTSQARIGTDRPSRYLVQLCRHADGMRRAGAGGHRPRTHGGAAHAPPVVRHAEWTDTAGVVRLAGGAEWTMHAAPGTLTVRVSAPEEGDLRRIEELVAGRLERIGRRDGLTVTWQPAAPGPDADRSDAAVPSGPDGLRPAAVADDGRADPAAAPGPGGHGPAAAPDTERARPGAGSAVGGGGGGGGGGFGGVASGRPSPVRPGPRTAVAAALVVLLVAAHVALGDAVSASWGWPAAGAVALAVAVKAAVALRVHAAHRGRR